MQTLRNYDFAWYRAKMSRRDLIKRLRFAKTQGKRAVTSVNYNNLMYAVAGEAAANVVGVAYEALVEEKVLKPLGLKSTGFGQLEMKKHFNNYALPYESDSFEDAVNERHRVGPLLDICGACAPAGDLYSNVSDLVRYGQTIMKLDEINGQQVLNKESIQEIIRAHNLFNMSSREPDMLSTLSNDLGWNLGGYKGKNFIMHNGLISSFSASLMVFVDHDLVIAQLVNTDVVGLISNVPLYVANKLLDLQRANNWITISTVDSKNTYELKNRAAASDIPAQIKGKMPSHGLSAFTGKYKHPVYGDISIQQDAEEEKALRFKINCFEGKMEHYHYDSFKLEFRDFGMKQDLLGTFQTDRKGNISRFKVKVFDSTKEVNKVNEDEE
ncbi:hypothetical protein BX616_011264 [Lobosporangium transversale]|nr:hypothetical protein BX616_011264 [Lobosporangium transversale]